MKRLLILLALPLVFLISCSSEGGIDLKVLTLNIRYDNPSDAPNDWPARKDFVLSFLEKESPAIFGLQEALWHQYSYLDSALLAYESVGAGRDDGKSAGEMTPVFYKKDLFSSLQNGTFWLSNTPAVPGSKGWGAVLPRIVTWVELKHIESGGVFYYFNTHYSHMSDSARLMSSHVLLEQVVEIAGDYPFVITGDFNMTPQSKAYDVLTEDGNEDALVLDSWSVCETDPWGIEYTYNGFSDEPGTSRIDYIFVSRGVDVIEHITKTPKNDKLFLSDHWPVSVRAVIPHQRNQP